jgi:hypothetical protein
MSFLTSAVRRMREENYVGLLYMYWELSNYEFIITFNKILITCE